MMSTMEVPFEVGKAYLFRTVTMFWTGRMRAIQGGFIVLDDCARIDPADIGRVSLALEKGADVFTGVEVVPDGSGVAIGAVIDYQPWHHPLPRTSK